MPELTYQHPLPPADECHATVSQASATANPVTDLLELARSLWTFERRYQMTSAQFYAGYQAGILEDELQHCVEWVAVYRMFLKTQQILESTLMRAAVQPAFQEITA